MAGTFQLVNINSINMAVRCFPSKSSYYECGLLTRPLHVQYSRMHTYSTNRHPDQNMKTQFNRLLPEVFGIIDFKFDIRITKCNYGTCLCGFVRARACVHVCVCHHRKATHYTVFAYFIIFRHIGSIWIIFHHHRFCRRDAGFKRFIIIYNLDD